MQKPEIPPNEKSRLETLRTLGVLDSPKEERFDRLTRMARRMFDVPIALVSLVDENRQWFKSCVGITGLKQHGRFRFVVTRSLMMKYLLCLMLVLIAAFLIIR